MTLIHILQTPTASVTPWWPATKRLRWTWGRRLWTECCCCKMPAREVDARIRSYFDYPKGGLGGESGPTDDYFIPFDYPTGAYYSPTVEFQCADGFGCTVNPRRKIGRHLREEMRAW